MGKSANDAAKIIPQFVFHKKCPSCSKNTVITDLEDSEIFCKNCGLVLEDKLENLGQREIIDFTKNNLRTGPFASLANYNPLLTMIDSANIDAFGKTISLSSKYNFDRLRKWDQRTHTSIKEKNLSHALSELSKICEKISLPESVIEDAAYIYRKILEKKLVKGRSISSMVAASIYCACRKQGVPRTMKDVTDTMNIHEKQLAKSYRIVLRELNLKMPVQDSTYWVFKIASALAIDEKISRASIDLIKLAVNKEISAGKHPVALAATALYLVSMNTKNSYTQREIARAANITDVTIRNRIKNLVPLFEELKNKH